MRERWRPLARPAAPGVARSSRQKRENPAGAGFSEVPEEVPEEGLEPRHADYDSG
jgi:hypothetical protein